MKSTNSYCAAVCSTKTLWVGLSSLAAWGMYLKPRSHGHISHYATEAKGSRSSCRNSRSWMPCPSSRAPATHLVIHPRPIQHVQHCRRRRLSLRNDTGRLWPRTFIVDFQNGTECSGHVAALSPKDANCSNRLERRHLQDVTMRDRRDARNQQKHDQQLRSKC